MGRRKEGKRGRWMMMMRRKERCVFFWCGKLWRNLIL